MAPVAHVASVAPTPTPPPLILTSTFFPFRDTATPGPIKLISLTDFIILCPSSKIPTAPPPVGIAVESLFMAF